MEGRDGGREEGEGKEEEKGEAPNRLSGYATVQLRTYSKSFRRYFVRFAVCCQ